MPVRYYAQHSDEEESYFISMTDVVIGLLFVFIIMLMFFAMRFHEAAQRQTALTEDLTDAETDRGDILDTIGRFLQDQGVNVIIVKDEGILRLPEEILFEKSRAELNDKGRAAIQKLAQALDLVLPCYTLGTRSREHGCPATKAKVEAVFVEGHADSDPYRNPSAGLKDNLDLSAIRATSTFRELMKAQEGLRDYRNPNGTPVLSVSGYGEYRPIAVENDDAGKQRNRRIDLRILMATPRSEDAKRMQRDLQRFETGK